MTTTTNITNYRMETPARTEADRPVRRRMIVDERAGETVHLRTNPEALMTEFTEAFNRHDAAELAQLFTTDAVFINIFGLKMQGRTGIERGHRIAFDGRLGAASMKLVTIDRTTADANVTILRAGWTLEQDASAEMHALVPAGTGTLTAVARRIDGNWVLVGAANVRDTQPPS